MDKQIIYFKTSSSSRGMYVGFVAYTRELIIKHIKNNENNYNDKLRWCLVDGESTSGLLKEMSLTTFKKEFPDADEVFTPAEVTKYFSKEISKIYGEHKAINEIKFLKGSEIKPFHIYEDIHGSQYIYLGKVINTESFSNSANINTREGHAFISVSNLMGVGSTGLQLNKNLSRFIDIVKNKRKYVKEIGRFEPNFEFKDEYTSTMENVSYYRTHHPIITTFTTKYLDFKLCVK